MSYESDASGYDVLRTVLNRLPDADWADFLNVRDLPSLSAALLDYIDKAKARNNGALLADHLVAKNPDAIIGAIKEFRAMTGLPLKESKDAIVAARSRAALA